MIKKHECIMYLFNKKYIFNIYSVSVWITSIYPSRHFVVIQKTYKDMYNYILSITNGKCLYIHSVSVCWIYILMYVIHKSRLSPPYILLYSYKCAALTCPLGGQISICLHCPLWCPD